MSLWSEVPDLLLIKMSPPTSLKAKGKQKATEDEIVTFDDPGDALGSSSDSGSDGDSDSDSDSDQNSVSDSGSSIEQESESDSRPEARTDDPPLSRDELLAYLENMRRRFSTKPTTDSFADQEEEVLVVTSKKSGVIQP
jgi:hypothetical protein